MNITCVPVGMLSTACYILYDEGRDDCIVIDPGDEAGRIRAAMGGRKLAAILLTHGHFDHIGAADALMEDNTVLMIHTDDAKLLRDPSLNCSWMVNETILCNAVPRLLQEGDEPEAAGLRFRVLHTPGHTAGGACYEFGSDLFTGDTLFEQGYGRTDLPTGDERRLMQSLRRLMPLRADHRIHGGHC